MKIMEMLAYMGTRYGKVNNSTAIGADKKKPGIRGKVCVFQNTLVYLHSEKLLFNAK